MTENPNAQTNARTESQAISMHELLKETVKRGASDLHLTAGVPPM